MYSVILFDNICIHTLWVHLCIIFLSCFYLIIVTSVTSKSSLPNCELVPRYQRTSQSKLVKLFLVLPGEFLTGTTSNWKISALQT